MDIRTVRRSTVAGAGSSRGIIGAMDEKPAWQPRDSDAEVGDVLLSAEAIAEVVRRLGADIARDYKGRQPLLVGVLKGAFVFMADLMRAIALPTEVDFLAVSSYGASTTSSGVVRILKDLDVALTGRDVIVVEDIVDSGLTLGFLLENLAARGAASLAVCALLVRDGILLPKEVTSRLRYTGFTLPPTWVVGYGLDAGDRNRHLSAIHTYRAPGSAQ